MEAESRALEATPLDAGIAAPATPRLRGIPSRGFSLELARDYLALTKPRIVGLLLVTAVATMIVADPGGPPIAAVLWTMLGGYLAAGGAGAINHYLDREVDARMARTSRRPLVSGRIQPSHGLLFGITLGLLAFAQLAITVNLPAAALAMAGLLGYVLVYTLWLKPLTPQNIVIGGAAGAVPPLVGWAAATGGVSLEALYPFAIVFFWTPPHFWALSLFVRSDYAAAGIPMLPVVAGVTNTRRQIFLYSLPMAAAAVVPWPLGLTGPIYGVLASGLSLAFVALALPVLANRATEPKEMAPEKRLFGFSVLYLFALFGALVADRWIAW
jgi:heme o synthase